MGANGKYVDYFLCACCWWFIDFIFCFMLMFIHLIIVKFAELLGHSVQSQDKA